MNTNQSDYSPSPSQPSKSTSSPTPPSHQHHSHHSVSAKSIVGIALVSLLIAFVLVGANKYLQRETSTTPKAAIDKTVKLSLQGQEAAKVGDRFEVNVQVSDTSSREIAAVDMTFIPTNLKIIKAEAKSGQFFDATGIAKVAPPDSLINTTVRATILKPFTANRFALGAVCDYCYKGDKPSQTDFPGLTTVCEAAVHGCYPKVAANSPKPLATLTVEATNAGAGYIKFNSDKTQVAVMGKDGAEPPNESALLSATQYSVQISGDPTSCSKYDFNNKNGIDLLDAVAVIKNIGINPGESGYDAKYDFDGKNGIDLMDAIEIIKLIGTNCN